MPNKPKPDTPGKKRPRKGARSARKAAAADAKKTTRVGRVKTVNGRKVVEVTEIKTTSGKRRASSPGLSARRAGRSAAAEVDRQNLMAMEEAKPKVVKTTAGNKALVTEIAGKRAVVPMKDVIGYEDLQRMLKGELWKPTGDPAYDAHIRKLLARKAGASPEEIAKMEKDLASKTTSARQEVASANKAKAASAAAKAEYAKLKDAVDSRYKSLGEKAARDLESGKITKAKHDEMLRGLRRRRTAELAKLPKASTPVAEKPAKPASNRVAKKTTTPKPAKDTTVAKPTETKPTTKKPKVEKPVVAKPTDATKPAAKKPAAKKPAAKKPAKGGRKVVKVSGGVKSVDQLTAEIDKIDQQLSSNAKAVRAGNMTEAEKVAARKALTAQKNELLKQRSAAAKAAGVKIDNTATRPSRASQTGEPAKPKAKAKAKPKAPKVTAPKAEVPAPAAPAAKKAAKKPAAKKAPAKKTVANKPAAGKAAAKKTAPAARKAAAKKVVAAVAKTEGGSAGGLARKIGSKLVGKGASKFAKGLGIVGTVLTIKDILDAAIEYDRENPAKVTGKPTKASTKQLVTSADYWAGAYGGKPKGGKAVTPTRRPKVSAAANAAEISRMKSRVASDAANRTARTVGGSAGVPSAGGTGGKPSTKPAAIGSYRVKSGDTIEGIARKYGVSVSAIYKANPVIAQRTKAGKVDIFRNTLVRIPKK